MPYGSCARFLALPLSLLVCGFVPAQRRPASVTPPVLSAEETDGLVERIRRQEYRFETVSSEQGTWSAPNRAQGLRSRVSKRGLEVFPREASADGEGALWKLELATTSFGRADGTFELPRASVSVAGERVELDHGYLVEWFVNDERGLEQGWTIPERLIGAEALSIGLAIEGELSLRIEDGGRSGVFVDACGEAVLRYRDLRAYDATGRELDARIVPTPVGVAIEVDDSAAAYPLTVDPLLTAPAWTAESNQADAGFGSSVSTAGDVNGDGYSDVVVGARGFDNGQLNEGRAFVYLGAPGGLATGAAWTAEPDQEHASFGSSVCSAGDVNGDGYSDVIVAMTPNLVELEERVYVYHGSSSGLDASPAWIGTAPPIGTSLESFADAVASAGDVNSDGYDDVIIGIPAHTNGQFSEGAACVFHGSPNGLSTSADWTAESNEYQAFFGFSVSTAGDVNGDGHSDVIIGAWNFENGVGRAYLYRGSPSGLESTASWAESESWMQSEFGTSVSTAGDVNGDGYSDVVIGAPYHGFDFEGRAFVYLGSASGLGANPASFVSGQESSALLGKQVATAGDVNGDGFSDVIVGARGAGNLARAHVYQGSAGGLATTPTWITVADQSAALLSLATAGDVNGDGYSDVILGMSGYDNGQSNEGRAYVYHGSASGLAASSAWNKESNQAGAQLGISVSTAGDVNGDGYSDVIVGAHAYDGGQTDEGRAFVYHGSASGPAPTASWTAESNQESAYLGISVATAGDVNADGYSDVIVGAYFHDDGEADEGGAYVYHGSASGLGPDAAWSAQSDQASGWLGDSVSSAGDVNGDGYGDVVVGAPGYDGGQADEGRAYVYHGSASGLTASPAWWAESEQPGALFGEAVSTAGDANGDGYSDVIIGASSFDAGQVDEGRAFLYLGSSEGLTSSAAWTAESDQANARFGYSIATAGDVNGDGYSDAIVGAYAFDNGQTDEGRTFVYQGSGSGLLANAAWTAEADQGSAFFGYSVSTAGDVNGDGYSDVVVGAVWYDNGESNEGRAVVYHGSASGLAPSAAWTAESNQASALLGNAIATAGDVNGDGYSDVIVGAPYFDGGEGDEGRVWIYLGNDGRGGPLRGLQQRTHDGQAPLPLLGETGASGAFRIHGELATGVSGASTARLEWELKPLGIPFNGQGLESGAPLSGPGGGPLLFDESVSPAGSRHLFAARAGTYRWRVRVATDDPLYPHTPWFSVPGNAVTEAKLRKSAFRFP